MDDLTCVSNSVLGALHTSRSKSVSLPPPSLYFLFLSSELRLEAIPANKGQSQDLWGVWLCTLWPLKGPFQGAQSLECSFLPRPKPSPGEGSTAQWGGHGPWRQQAWGQFQLCHGC